MQTNQNSNQLGFWLFIANLVAVLTSVLTLVTFVFSYFLVFQYPGKIEKNLGSFSTFNLAPSNFAINPNVFLHAFVYCGREKVNKTFTYSEGT